MAISLADAIYLALDNAYLHEQVFEAMQTAETANQAKNEFISVVTHELKNPMTSIRGYTDLLQRGAVGPVTPEQNNFLDTIKINIRRLQTLVSDLSDVSRIESGRLNIQPQSIFVQEILAETIRSIHSQIQAKEQAVDVEISPDLPMVWADPVRLAQILTNLLSNAHKYTPSGGKIIVSAGYSSTSPHFLQIEVRDNGLGIQPEDQQRLFQKFFRANDIEARQAPGTGLGLNITRSLIELQGGEIWFESQYRQGTSFYFTLPLAVKQEGDASQ